MSDRTHECLAPFCAKRVGFNTLACYAHWRSIPYELRQGLNAAWASEPGTERYFHARADCLRALGVPATDIARLNAGVE